MSFINQYREQLKQHTTSTLLLSALILFTLLLVILRLSLSAIIILSTEKWLASQHLEANIERIEISLFSGHVSLHNAEAQNAQQQGFKIGELSLDWNWLPLLRKHVEINKITLRDFSINAELHHNGVMNIGGIKLPASQADNAISSQAKETEQAASIWQASIHNIELNNIDVCAAQLDQDNQPLVDYCSQLEQLQWQGELAYLPDPADTQNAQSALPLYTDGSFNLQQFELHNNLLQLDLLSIGEINLPDVKFKGVDSIQLQTLDIKQLALLQQATDDTPEKPVSEIQFNNLLAFERLKLGPISIMQSQQISLGDLVLSGLRSQAPINTDNQLDIGAWIPAQTTQNADQHSNTDNNSGKETQLDSETRQQSSDTKTLPKNTENQSIHLAIDNIQLNDSVLCTEHAGNTELKPLSYCLSLDNVDWQGTLSFGKNNAQSEDSESSSLPLYANGNFSVNQLSMKNHRLDLNLLSVDKIQLDTLSMQTIDNINIAELGIQQLSTFERKQKNRDGSTGPQTQYIFAFENFSIQPIKLAPNEVILGKSEITGSQLTLVINQQGKLELDQWQLQPSAPDDSQVSGTSENNKITEAEEKSSTETSQASATTHAMRFSLDELIFKSDKKSTFLDQSTQQGVQLVIEQIDIKLKDINSIQDDNQSTASLFIRFKDQSEIKLDIEGTPLADKPNIKGTGSISALDLKHISPLTRQHLGRSIRSGQLDADLDINVKQGHADSLLDLKLRHFVLRTLNEEEAAKLDKNLGFPLNTSLNLLRDKDNQIHLEIPITQDIADLNIDIKPVIYKAISKSVSNAIVSYYTPFGLVFVAESLFDMATALKFKPALFEPGKANLTESSKAELEKLAVIMDERPGIHLTLCGFSNLNDISRGDISRGNAQPENQSTNEKPALEISAEQRQELLKLAGSRSSVVKQYLINTHQISASRLVECEAHYDADGIAGVEIKL
jgi:hypothetical protein